MSVEAVQRARAAWFAAQDLEARFGAIHALQQHAGVWATWDIRKEAMRALIELMHVADHPALRTRLIEALGVVPSLQVVPALHAELHHPEPSVRLAAVRALGAQGKLFAGAVVARWLKPCDRSLEPRGMMDAALSALATSGHPDTATWAGTLWKGFEVEPTTLHLALAEVGSHELVDLAIEHLQDPVAAIPAALHLSAVRHPELPSLLRPLLRSSDLQQVHTAEALLTRAWPTPQDDVMGFLTEKLWGAALGRRARRLRVHPPDELVDVFELFREEHPQGTTERGRFLSRMAAIGVPELQAAMFAWMLDAGTPADQVSILREATTRHEGMEAQLGVLQNQPDPDVVVYTLRCQVNLLDDHVPETLARWVSDPRGAVATESVRSAATLFRDRKGVDRKTQLTGAARRSLEIMLRTALREGDSEARVQAAYAVGNLGLTALGEDLLRLRDDADMRVRQGAATSLDALPAHRALDAIGDWMLEESEPDVRVRLGLTLLRGLRAGGVVPAKLEDLARAARADRDDLKLIGLHLLGFAASSSAIDQLEAAATDPRLATAAAALTALGASGQARVRGCLETASHHPDPMLRRRAVESLGALGTAEAASTLWRVAREESDVSVRRTALRGLVRTPCSALEAQQLAPRGPTDRLMVEVLEAKVAASGRRLDVAAVDAALEERFPGFKVGRLAQQSRDALRALRTAHFLDSGVSLPDGLDAAPPVVFWAKGIELWMDVLLRPVLQELRSPGGRKALKGVSFVWSALERSVPGWTADGGHRWKTILSVVQRSADDPRKVWTLRALAGAVLCGGPLAVRLGLPERLGSVESAELGSLAYQLVCLSDLRNDLTHHSAGRTTDADKARAHAEAIGRSLASW